MPVSAKTFKQVALEDPSGRWELVDGRLQQKPAMTANHNRTTSRLFGWVFQQVDPLRFEVRSNHGHVQRSSRSYYLPDVHVVPIDLVERQIGNRRLEVFSESLPLIIEVWSPSTGDFDVETKVPEYQMRGDREIWRVHPFEKTLISWVRERDGTYTETLHTHGMVRAAALPNLTIDLDALFA
jgi:Uma2 family endonuclease